MIRRLLRFIWSIVVLSAVVWFVFFVELGERTLFQHLARIAQTDEARDLGREMRQAGERVGEEARRAIEEGRERREGDDASRDGATADSRGDGANHDGPGEPPASATHEPR